MTRSNLSNESFSQQKRQYNRIDGRNKEILIQMVVIDGAKTIAEISRKLNIEYENAKAICRKFRIACKAWRSKRHQIFAKQQEIK